MLLITGANGQLGTELRRILGSRAEYLDREHLDISDEQAVKSFFDNKKYDFVINCAAYTAVDNAEVEPELAENINHYGPLYLSKYAKRILHISTDYIFDGEHFKPYTEVDKPNPKSVYGRTKLAGENAVLESAETAVILRTSWLYSPFGKNFLKTIRKLAEKNESIHVVNDQIGTPTYTENLANAILTILPQIKQGQKSVYHVTNEGVCSWYDFAYEIVALLGLKCKVIPITSENYPSRAKRPFYSVLCKEKIRNDFGIQMPHWKEGLEQCLKQF